MNNPSTPNLLKSLIDEAISDAMQGTPVAVDLCMRIAAAVDAIDAAAGADTSESAPYAPAPGIDALAQAADAVRTRRCGNMFHTCSIVNGRSGRCTENCAWCSQAAGHHTGCREYLFVPDDEYYANLDANTAVGTQRFSIVCSGRKVGRKDVDRYCELYRSSAQRSPMQFCASMGLLGRDELQALYDAGVRRYHCNLETAASHFPNLCTSHTRQDKLRTIEMARQVGMEVCSGGIIGMGESLRQRLELAQEAREAGAVSIPVNLLNPIPGTPLEGTPLLGERAVVLTVALMRLVAPNAVLRFAGGRARLSQQATRRILLGGANGAIIGDMLTTVGNSVADDLQMIQDLGYKL